MNFLKFRRHDDEEEHWKPEYQTRIGCSFEKMGRRSARDPSWTFQDSPKPIELLGATFTQLSRRKGGETIWH